MALQERKRTSGLFLLRKDQEPQTAVSENSPSQIKDQEILRQRPTFESLEIKVLGLMLEGITSRKIVEALLNESRTTVSKTFAGLFEKAGVKDSYELTIWAFNNRDLISTDNEPDTSSETWKPHSVISHRKKQMALMVAEGLKSKEIANSYGISPSGVDAHISALMAELGIKGDKRELIIFVKRHPDLFALDPEVNNDKPLLMANDRSTLDRILEGVTRPQELGSLLKMSRVELKITIDKLFSAAEVDNFPALITWAFENNLVNAEYVTNRQKDRPLVFSSEISRRKREVAHAVAEGKKNNAIADELGLSHPTLQQYMTELYNILGIHDKVHLSLYVNLYPDLFQLTNIEDSELDKKDTKALKSILEGMTTIPELKEALCTTGFGVNSALKSLLKKTKSRNVAALITWSFTSEMVIDVEELKEKRKKPTVLPEEINDRSKEVAIGISEGKTYKEIADKMGITRDGVSSHISILFAKLHIGEGGSLSWYVNLYPELFELPEKKEGTVLNIEEGRAIKSIIEGMLSKSSLQSALSMKDFRVRSVLESLYEKTGTHNIPGLISWAFTNNIVSDEDRIRYAQARPAIGATEISVRQKEVAVEISRGSTYKEAATKLQISEYSVDTHIKRLFLRLGIHDTGTLSLYMNRYPDLFALPEKKEEPVLEKSAVASAG